MDSPRIFLSPRHAQSFCDGLDYILINYIDVNIVLEVLMSAISAGSLANPSHRVTVATTSAVRPSVVFTARLLYTAIFLVSGLTHFSSQVIGYAASAGVPLASLAVPVAGVLAIAGGLSI